MSKNKLIKRIISIYVVISIVVSMSIVSVNAAEMPSLYLVIGPGRISSMIYTGGEAKFETINKITTSKDMLTMPMIQNGTTYVPFRYVMEKAGFVIGWDNMEQAVTINRRSGDFCVFEPNISNKPEKLYTAKIKYANDMFTFADRKGDIKSISVAEAITFFDKMFIPVRELEKLGFIIHWDSRRCLIHIAYDTSNMFMSNCEKIIAETDPQKKATLIENYTNGIINSNRFSDGINKYIYIGTDANNSLNNSLVYKNSSGTYVSIVKETKSTQLKTFEYGTRQITYAEGNGKKELYYIGDGGKQIYKSTLSNNRLSGKSKVELPNFLNNKKITQLIIEKNRMFFIAYDNAADGGYIYMAKPGDEKNTAVKVSSEKAWNLVLTNQNELYYINMDKNSYLCSINLKDANTLKDIYENNGAIGTIIKNQGIQFFIKDQDSDDLYYTDVVSGSINKSSNGVDTEVVKAINGNVLMNFLNLQSTKSGNVLYYMEYANGKIKDFDLCKIMAYNFSKGTTETVYTSDKMIMELTIVDETIYFTNADYSALYKIESTTNGYTFTEI